MDGEIQKLGRMKYFLIAGEASGDLHASNLMAALKEKDPEADFRFFGGDLMQAVGGTLVKHYKEMAFMGFIPVLLNLRTILNNMKTCQEDIRKYQPDVVILIDYPGFNLKIAKFVKTVLHLPVYYYISPKIWAWKQYRIKDFRRYVDRMFCILPFETEFFRKLDYSVDYVGNPSVDSVAQYKEKQANRPDTFMADERLPDKPILALLAGSRRQEIKDNLPTMLEVAAAYPDYQPVIAGAPGLEPKYYKQYIGNHPAKIVFGKTYDLLQHSRAALVTSGTATLETSLFRVPQVVCYYVVAGPLASFIFRNFFHTKYISLVNLIAGREVVQELFGARFSYQQIHDELGKILHDTAYRQQMLDGYDEIIQMLGKPGASQRTAELIYQSLKH
jgi:lipid-A-disaccharide synthase